MITEVHSEGILKKLKKNLENEMFCIQRQYSPYELQKV